MDLQPVILCGGSGSRLWPLSREHYPKQLVALTGQDSMLQITAARVGPDFLFDQGQTLAPMIVANEHYRFLIGEQMVQLAISPSSVILEPVARNTAPALTLAALCAIEQDSDPVLLVMPADQMIADTDAFREAVVSGITYAADGRLVTFGVLPTHAETGYGYIGLGERIEESGARLVSGFTEKPDYETARQYVVGGGHLWNSGIFMMRASTWLELISLHRADILNACAAAIAAGERDHEFLHVDAQAFYDCPAESIDYAVMEKLGQDTGIVIALRSQWSDVGTWDALWRIADKDEDGNLLDGDVLALNSRSTLAISQSRLVACVGVENLVVVETPDAVLVMHKDSLHGARSVVSQLKRRQRCEVATHRKIYRPWGHYDSIDRGERFQVKRLCVNPGARLSLQMHHHRAEHWVVVRGTARVTCGDKSFLVEENQSAYIPLGQTHRLENPGKIPLEIIEVQSGAYVGEDDVVRFEDRYS